MLVRRIGFVAAAVAVASLALFAHRGRRPQPEPGETIEALSRQFEQVANNAAPYGEVAEGAGEAATQQRGQRAHEGGGWRQIGNAPLYANAPAYNDFVDGVSSLGWV